MVLNLALWQMNAIYMKCYEKQQLSQIVSIRVDIVFYGLHNQIIKIFTQDMNGTGDQIKFKFLYSKKKFNLIINTFF